MGGTMRAMLLAAALWVFAAEAPAITLLEYGTAGSTTTLSPSLEASGVNGAGFTAGPGITVQSFSTFNFTNWDPANTSAAAAIADDEFWTWGFTADPGVTFDLTSFDIRLDRSGAGPDDFEIFLAVNGGANTSVLTFDYQDASDGVDFLGVDLSSFTGVSDAVFTLAAFNAELTAGTFDLEALGGGSTGTAFRLEGLETSHVPLPGALPLLLGGLLGLGLIARRRREV